MDIGHGHWTWTLVLQDIGLGIWNFGFWIWISDFQLDLDSFNSSLIDDAKKHHGEAGKNRTFNDSGVDGLKTGCSSNSTEGSVLH